MKILLKPDWETKVSFIKSRVYSLGNNVQQLVENIFNKMYKQRSLKFTTDPTSFSFPVFVIWKIDARGKKKGRSIIDIRKLDKLLLSNSYLLLLQSEIIANV